MKISFIGSGYIGQVNAASACHYGHDTILVDIEEKKVNSINKGIPTIYEKGLDDLLHDLVINKKKMIATLDFMKAINDSEVSFICVGTPDKGGMIDLSQIQSAAIDIGKVIKTKNTYHVVVVKSTVVPGTTLSIVKPLVEQYSGKKAGLDFGIAMNPEFLREGVALDDCIHPDSIVLGTQDEKTKKILKEIYSWSPEEKFTYVGINAAEAIKYAKNTFLAMKISFANEWANYCEAVGIDSKEVLTAIGADHRISPMFLRNGPGYGGSCFPKDVNAIIHAAQVNHSPLRIMEQVVAVNQTQYLRMIDQVKAKFGNLNRRKVGVLGLSFKPDTDDVRYSPSLKIISYLTSLGCDIKTYCPKGMPMAKEWFTKNKITDIKYVESARSCVQDVEFVLIPTDWSEFREILPEITVPVFIGHRSFIEPSNYKNISILGFPDSLHSELE